MPLKPLTDDSAGSGATGSVPESWPGRMLRGESLAWPADIDATVLERFLAACQRHGVGPLLYHRYKADSNDAPWPGAIREALAREAHRQAAVDLLRERELIVVLEALAAAGVQPLLLKGTPLAYTHYPAPALRPRCDTDLLILPAEREIIARVLEKQGYRSSPAVSGMLISSERTYYKPLGVVAQVLDVHWRINNAPVLAQALDYTELAAAAIPVPVLGPAARTLAAPHALLLACLHRAAHSVGAERTAGDRLIWLHDLHLLSSAMDADEWRVFTRLCVHRQMRSIGLEGLHRARETLDTVIPDTVWAQLAEPGYRELSSEYLRASRWRALVVNLRALPSNRERWRLLWELGVPAADFILAKYRTDQRWRLPWLYLRRAGAGIWKFSRRS